MSPLCAATGCTNPVPTSGRPGRPAIYCTPDCRPSRKPGTRPRPAQPPLTVELADINNETNPPGRNPKNWAIRLRRGPRTVTINQGLGRFTATALAADLQHLIHHQGAATD